ncbi:MAG: recombinase family protein [Dolichospermum sp.]
MYFPGGHRRYPESAFIKTVPTDKERVLYARVSTKTQLLDHKDRLCRFGFDFVEWFCHLHGCKIVVVNNAKLSSQEELMQDFMAIMHCFSSKLYFLRAYKKKIAEEQNIHETNSSEYDSIGI